MEPRIYAIQGQPPQPLMATRGLSGSPPAATSIPPIAEVRRPMVPLSPGFVCLTLGS